MKALLAVVTPKDRELLCAGLAKYKVQAVCAGPNDNLEALYQQELPQWLVLDLDWPCETAATLQRLRRLRPRKGFLQVLLLASAAQQQRAATCLRYAHDLLYRPCSELSIKAKLRQLILLYKMQASLAYERQRATEFAYQLERYQAAGEVLNTLVEPCRQYYPNIKHLFLPASALSGDLLLVEYPPAGNQYILLGDVTGHGFTAFMGTLPLTQCYSDLTRKSCHLGELVHELNRLMCRHLPAGVFVATALVELDPLRRRMRLWNGGLPDALVWRAERNVLQSLPSKHCAMGITPDIDTQCHEVHLEVDDCVYLYTDGLIEAHNARDEQFGNARLQACLLENNGACERFDRVCMELAQFTADTDAHDDMTFIEVAPHLLAKPVV
jgi:serine phosphatase RsbU (regulator of sigma subunit)